MSAKKCILACVFVLVGGLTLIHLSAGAQEVPIAWSVIAPLPLARHSGVTAVVDGIIYVIGGIEEGNTMTVYGQTYAVTTGAVVEAYDPTKDTWEERAPLPYPINMMTRKAEGRQWLAAAAFDGKIYTFGGANLYGEVRDTIDVYDVESDTWTAGIGRLPRPIVGLSAVTYGERIYLFGGSSSTDPFASPDYLDGAYAFDPATGAVTALAKMPAPRVHTRAVVFRDGILVFGGISAMGVTNAQWYDPATDSWQRLTSVAWERRFWFGDAVADRVFLIGGRDSHAESSTTIDVYLEEFDAWATGAPLLTPREDAFVASVEGTLYVIGGLNQDGTPLAAAEKGIPDLGSIAYEAVPPPPPDVVIEWTPCAPMPTPRSYGATAVVDDVIYTLGGLEAADPTGTAVEAYDCAADRWVTKANLPEGRFNVAAAAFEGKIYLFGGATINREVVDTVDVYDPATDTWQARVATLPAPTAGIAAVTYGDRIYLFGGSRSAQMFVPAENYYDTVYAFDPRALTFEAMSAMPFARNMAYAGAIEDTIEVIGGMRSPGSTANQQFNAVTGTWLLKAELPGPHGGHSGIVWPGPHGGVIFIIGGANTFDVFVWDKESDRWYVGSSLPTARNVPFTAASAACPNAFFVIGGVDASGNVLADVTKGVVRGETLP